MRFARPELLAALLLAATPALAARKPRVPPPPPLPPLVLPAAAPVIDAQIAGQPVRLTVDWGGDPMVLVSPEAAARLQLASNSRAGGQEVSRGRFRVSVGQTHVAVPFSRELLAIAGRSLTVPVLTPVAPPAGQAPGSDGVIGLPLLPHDEVQLVYRAATARDRLTGVNAGTSDRSSSLTFEWPLPGQPPIEVELHQLRPASVASVSAASRLAAAGDGKLTGAVRRVAIGFGVARPVRTLVLARPLPVAGIMLAKVDVRLFDWAGRADLPPDADDSEGAMVTASRGRQSGWPILKLGRDVLDGCASITWRRDVGTPGRGSFDLHC
ncbi:hypothetical protein [Sandarakinorhabdus sp. AAP62]|uniref:hypothetical protein n=1 Tax=Sandarakinorhabdus sp. AAP62 TaxID=1248916 RepID=UPI000301993E|nr:hypothetical protein [Sandarakinorhabdus sp. AAP62]